MKESSGIENLEIRIYGASFSESIGKFFRILKQEEPVHFNFSDLNILRL